MHDFERMARTVFAHDRREARAGGLRSFPVLQEQALILARDPGLYRIPRRRTRAADLAQLAHMPSQRVDARLLPRAIEFLDRVVDELVLFGRKPARALLRPTAPGDERADDRRSAKLLDQFIKPRPSDAQLSTGLVDCSRLDQSFAISGRITAARSVASRQRSSSTSSLSTLFTSRPRAVRQSRLKIPRKRPKQLYHDLSDSSFFHGLPSLGASRTIRNDADAQRCSSPPINPEYSAK